MQLKGYRNLTKIQCGADEALSVFQDKCTHKDINITQLSKYGANKTPSECVVELIPKPLKGGCKNLLHIWYSKTVSKKQDDYYFSIQLII